MKRAAVLRAGSVADTPQCSSGADEKALGYLDLLTHVRGPGWIYEFAIMGQGAHTKGEKRSEVRGQSLGVCGGSQHDEFWERSQPGNRCSVVKAEERRGAVL